MWILKPAKLWVCFKNQAQFNQSKGIPTGIPFFVALKCIPIIYGLDSDISIKRAQREQHEHICLLINNYLNRLMLDIGCLIV